MDVVSAALVRWRAPANAAAPRRARVLWAGVGCVLTLSLGGCSSAPPPADTRPTAEALARDVLEAIAHRDESRLAALALSEQEFRDHVWPELPASRPERNLPFSYVWGDLRQKSRSSLSHILAAHGGRKYELVGLAFRGENDYGDYRVHREAVMTVRDASGTALELGLLGSMLERRRQWKVFSYVVDD